MNMNSEQHRLLTFNDWPGNAPVDPLRLAKAGFFSTNQGLEVECFACHIKISDWNYGDGAMARHIASSPECRFVMNASTSENIPTLSPLHGPHPNLYRVSAATRLATFDSWPISFIVTPERLANAGFYYLKEGDNTKCAFCKGVVRAWEPGDDPDSEHLRHFPNCQFVINVITPRLANAGRANSSVTSSRVGKDSFANITLVGDQQNFDELGVQAHKGPKRMNFATVESRLRSFESWSGDLIQTPDVLAQAGFYYEGFNDQVRCFHCDGGLRHWDPHDDPWTEHARWFPNCSFIKLVKGQEFVNACANPMESNPKPTRRPRREITSREIEEQLRSPQALAALQVGLSRERVKRALVDKMQTSGRPYSRAEALVDAALNLRDEDISDNSSSGSSSVRDPEDSASVQPSTEEIRRGNEDNMASRTKTRTENAASSTDNTRPSTGTRKPTTENVRPPGDGHENVLSEGSLEDENKIIEEARLCKICMNAEMGIVFLPCGHLATCVDCATYLEHCPVCRSSIKATVRAFFS